MKTPAKDKPVAYRGRRGTRLKYISDENLTKVQGGAQTAPADPARKKPDTSAEGNTAGDLHDAAAAAASQTDAGHPDAAHAPAGPSGTGNAEMPAPVPYIDPASADPAPGQSYADLRDKTVQALETAKLNFANEVDNYIHNHLNIDDIKGDDKPESHSHGPVDRANAQGPEAGHGDSGHAGNVAPADDLGDWMMVVPQQELSESQYRTLESAHQTVDAIRALQQGLTELQLEEALGRADVHAGDPDASHAPAAPASSTADGTVHETSRQPPGAQADDAFSKALALEAEVFGSKVDNLINDLQRDMPSDPDEAPHPADQDSSAQPAAHGAPDVGGQPAAHAAPDAHDDWVVIEQPFAVPLSEYEAAKGAHEDMQKTTALNVETLRTQIDDALHHLTVEVDAQSQALSATGTPSHADAVQTDTAHDAGVHPAADAGHEPSGHDTHEEEPVSFTDEDSHHAMSQLPDGDTHQAPHTAGEADGAVDDALMSMIKERLPELKDGKLALADAPKDTDDPSVSEALEAGLLKRMGEDADLVAADGGDFVTVTESHDAARHGGAGGNAGPATEPAPITVHDATPASGHDTTADPHDTVSFDHNAKSAETQGQVLAPQADADAPILQFGEVTTLTEEGTTPAGGHAADHPAAEEADAHSASPRTPVHPADEDTPAHSTEETHGHPVAEETNMHGTSAHDDTHPGSTEESTHPAGDETHARGTPEEGATHDGESDPAHSHGGTDSQVKARTDKEVLDDTYGVIDQRQSTVRTGDQIGHVTSDLPDGEQAGSHSASGTSSTDSVIVNADGVTVRTDQQAQAEAGGTVTKGPLTVEGDAKASGHASGEVHVGPDGIDIRGQAGADASVSGGVSVSGDLGHGVKGTVGVEDTAEAHAAIGGRIGTKGVEGAAAAGVSNTTAIGAGLTSDLGKNVSMTNEIHAGVVEQATAGAHAGVGSDGVKMGSGVSAGVYESIGTSISVGDDHYSGSAGADLHSPGAFGFAEDASATFNDGKVSFNIAGDIDLGIGGLAFHIGASIDVSGIEHKAEHAIEDAAKEVAKVLSSAAHTVEHALEQAGYAVADATVVAANAVAHWFKSW